MSLWEHSRLVCPRHVDDRVEGNHRIELSRRHIQIAHVGCEKAGAGHVPARNRDHLGRHVDTQLVVAAGEPRGHGTSRSALKLENLRAVSQAGFQPIQIPLSEPRGHRIRERIPPGSKPVVSERDDGNRVSPGHRHHATRHRSPNTEHERALTGVLLIGTS